jgi:hypothetical protein
MHIFRHVTEWRFSWSSLSFSLPFFEALTVSLSEHWGKDTEFSGQSLHPSETEQLRHKPLILCLTFKSFHTTLHRKCNCQHSCKEYGISLISIICKTYCFHSDKYQDYSLPWCDATPGGTWVPVWTSIMKTEAVPSSEKYMASGLRIRKQ